MPWFPDSFSAPTLERIRSHAADARAATPVPYFDGVRTGDTKALVKSFAGEPEIQHPLRGRIKGLRAFAWFVAYTNEWLEQTNAVSSSVDRCITSQRSVEEIALTLDGDQGQFELPVAIVAERDDDGRILELRIYYSTWPLTATHVNRPPLLQPDPELQLPDVIDEYQRALAAGDVDAAVATFEPDAYVREPAGGPYVHRDRDEVRALYERFFSNGGGIALEHCTVTDDGRACALEYNVVRWGRSEFTPQAGIAVYVRGSSGKLSAARIYDDAEPPLRS
jgi:SnoaL-like domain